MKKILAILFCLFSLPAIAADNALTVTVGSGLTIRTKDIGAGVQSAVNILGDTSGNPIYGTAGTANSNVLTIQGIASGTVIPVSLTSTTITGTVAATQSGAWNITNISGTISLPTGAGTSANQATMISSLSTIATNTGAAIPTQAGTVSIGGVGQIGTWTVQPGNTANTTAWLMTGSGTAGTAATGVVTVQGIASMTKLLVTPDSVALPANQSVNLSQVNGGTTATGNGVSGAQVQRVNVASDNTAFPVNAQPTAATTGGASSYYVQPAASDNHANIKNGAGTAYSVHFTNNSATRNYMRLYDAGTGFNGCNSATNIIFGMEIPPTDGGISVSLGGSVGLLFSTGLSICVTSGYGSTDTTNATATAMMGNVLYK